MGETCIDPTAIILRQSIELTNIPVGTARVVFDRVDFGNFLVHPLMTAAAQQAVQVGFVAGFQQAAAGLVDVRCKLVVASVLSSRASTHWRLNKQLYVNAPSSDTHALVFVHRPHHNTHCTHCTGPCLRIRPVQCAHHAPLTHSARGRD